MLLELIQDLLQKPRLAEGAAWVRREFRVGDNLVTEGTLGHSLFVIQQGKVVVLGRALLADRPNIEVPLAELTEGSVFGESALIEPYESIATVRALTDGSALEINGAMLSVYLDDHPDQGYLLFKYLLAVTLDNLAKTNRGVIELAGVGLKLHGLGRAGI